MYYKRILLLVVFVFSCKTLVFANEIDPLTSRFLGALLDFKGFATEHSCSMVVKELNAIDFDSKYQMMRGSVALAEFYKKGICCQQDIQKALSLYNLAFDFSKEAKVANVSMKDKIDQIVNDVILQNINNIQSESAGGSVQSKDPYYDPRNNKSIPGVVESQTDDQRKQEFLSRVYKARDEDERYHRVCAAIDAEFKSIQNEVSQGKNSLTHRARLEDLRSKLAGIERCAHAEYQIELSGDLDLSKVLVKEAMLKNISSYLKDLDKKAELEATVSRVGGIEASISSMDVRPENADKIDAACDELANLGNRLSSKEFSYANTVRAACKEKQELIRKEVLRLTLYKHMPKNAASNKTLATNIMFMPIINMKDFISFLNAGKLFKGIDASGDWPREVVVSTSEEDLHFKLYDIGGGLPVEPGATSKPGDIYYVLWATGGMFSKKKLSGNESIQVINSYYLKCAPHVK